MTYALDTNAIIEYLNGRKTVATKFLTVAKSGTPIVIPAVADYEVMRGFYHTPCVDRQSNYNRMKVHCPTIDVNSSIWDCAAQIWSKLRKSRLTIGDADLIIAAQCLVNGYVLVTHNTKHFAVISGLQLDDWT